jgi:hypothetical protein
MKNTIKWLSDFIFKSHDDEYNYLASSENLEDLERRQRLLSKGDAPIQKYNRFLPNYKNQIEN